MSERLQDALRSAGRRLTPQRRLILQVLEESNRHLDADALYDRVKARDPDVSLATVYRTLTVLKEMDLVEEHRLGEEHSHYESVRGKPHYHFTCLDCGRVIEFTCGHCSEVHGDLADQHGFHITGARVKLLGYCADCQA